MLPGTETKTPLTQGRVSYSRPVRDLVYVTTFKRICGRLVATLTLNCERSRFSLSQSHYHHSNRKRKEISLTSGSNGEKEILSAIQKFVFFTTSHRQSTISSMFHYEFLWFGSFSAQMTTQSVFGVVGFPLTSLRGFC